MSTSAGNIFVRSADGDGPMILLLHGFPSSSHDFRNVVHHLASRACVTMDFVGVGKSV
jgi:pimeloyl-ACP methyl ester carboxylesterase